MTLRVLGPPPGVAGEGWGPICGVPGLPVPDETFPHVNTRAEWANAGEDIEGGT
jgi:Sulfotransferase domain